jgi:hypothetical protein
MWIQMLARIADCLGAIVRLLAVGITTVLPLSVEYSLGNETAISSLAPQNDSRTISQSSMIKQMLDRTASLQNLIVRYSEARQLTPDPKQYEVLPKRIKSSLSFDEITGERDYVGTFRFLRGTAFYDLALNENTAALVRQRHWKTPLHTVIAISSERYENFAAHPETSTFGGVIQDVGPLPPNSTIDLALGLRLCYANKFMDESDLRAMKVQVASNGLVEATHQITHGAIEILTLDPSRGDAITRVQIATDTGAVYDDIRCTDWDSVDDVYVPRQITRLIYTKWENEPFHLAETRNLKVNELLLNDPSNTGKQMMIVWPKGSQVTDVRTQRSFKVESGNRTLSDEAIYEAMVGRAKKTASQRMPSDHVIASAPDTVQLLDWRWIVLYGILALMAGACISVVIARRQRR